MRNNGNVKFNLARTLGGGGGGGERFFLVFVVDFGGEGGNMLVQQFIQ